MAKKGFLGLNIKLSSDTIQKLSENEAAQAKIGEVPKAESDSTTRNDYDKPPKGAGAVTNGKSPAPNEVTTEKKTLAKEEEKKQAATFDQYSQYIHYEGELAVYTDPQTNTQYTWCATSNLWVLKSEIKPTEPDGTVYGFENDKHTYTDADGAKYIWDTKENAWFPNVDDDFLATYQMSYGFVDNTTKPEERKAEEEKREAEAKNALKRKMEAKKTAEWFDVADDHNTKVYVSNLPSEITEEQFVDIMQKCGLVMRDPKTQKMKVKLYTDRESGLFKGDALCCYIKIESVELALSILDGSDVEGRKIKVERARFQMKGHYDPTLKPKKKKKDKEKMKKIQEKLFDWRPEKLHGEPAKNERVVIIKNLFEPSLFDDEVHLLLEYQQDLREECTKLGEVRKVLLYDRHPEGVAQITMKEVEDAAKVVSLLNGRWFGKRQLTAEIWDGRTKYRIAETESEIGKRIDGWEKFLEGEEKDRTATTSADKDEKDQTATTSADKDEKDQTATTSADKDEKDQTATTSPDKDEKDQTAATSADKDEKDQMAASSADKGDKEDADKV